MKLTEALLGEHGVLYVLLDHVESEAAASTKLEEVQRLTKMLQVALVSHAKIENEFLFPALEVHIGPDGPLAGMRDEHEEIEEALADVAAATEFEVAVERLRDCLAQTRDHFATEEQFVFPLARDSMTEQELERLGDNWADRRSVALR